ncbi:MAG: glycosyltransferase family 1 protein [Bacteroides sp.]|nr:glycosyltransferase family 1 protein [Bacteroides sp.]
MIKILHIIHGLNLGGAETFIFNLLSGINSDEFRFDFAIQEPEIKHKQFEKLIYDKGGKIFIIKDFFKNPVAHTQYLKRVVKTGYDFVHIHINAFINPIPAIVATQYKSRVIIHSHNSQNVRGGILSKFVHKLNTSLFLSPKFIRLSCSRKASDWMFGSRGSKMILNAVDTERYSFSEKSRNDIRSIYGIKDRYCFLSVSDRGH